MPTNRSDLSFEAWLIHKSRSLAERYKTALDPRTLRYQENANSAMARVTQFLDLPRPLDPIRAVHQELFASIDELRTATQVLAYETTTISELLCIFPLRANHWTKMRLTFGRIPESPPHESLHMRTEPPGPGLSRYSIVVPTARLKNGETSRAIKRLNPPRVVFDLPDTLEALLTRYLEEVRPQVFLDAATSPFLFSLRSYGGLYSRLVTFQERHLIHPFDLERAWGIHPYRVLVATHAVKNATSNRFGVAASLLLDSEEMIKSTYGHYVPEDAHDDARAALASPKG